MPIPYLETNLELRVIERGEDKDYFLETDSYPVNLDLNITYLSRIQFPNSRAILVRTSPTTKVVTIHVMRNIDLYSSFVNFEVDLSNRTLYVLQQEGYIEIYLK